jgi:hypothetical protein
MGTISIGRSIAVVVAGLLLLGFIDQTLERTLVMTLAQAPIQDEAAYLAIRNRPAVLAVSVVTHALASLLTGYVLARLAGAYEVQHAMATAALAVMLVGFASLTPNVMLPPLWVRIAMVLVTPPALIAGAYVRGQARIIRMEREQS